MTRLMFTALSLLSVLFAPMTFAQSTFPQGVFRDTVKMTKSETGPFAMGLYAKGEKFVNEAVMFNDGGQSLMSAVVVYPHGGTVCNFERGVVTQVSETKFTASKTDDLFGDTTCKLDFTVSGDTLKITSENGCADMFCGTGGRFKGAKLSKVCEAGNADIADFGTGNMIIRPGQEKPCDYIADDEW